MASAQVLRKQEHLEAGKRRGIPECQATRMGDTVDWQVDCRRNDEYRDGRGNGEAGQYYDYKLEEFRKKKAAAKKAASNSQPRSADSTVYEKTALENGQTQCISSAGAATVPRNDADGESSGFLDCNGKSHGVSNASGSESEALTQDNAQSRNFGSPDLLQMQPKQEGVDPNRLLLKSQTNTTYQQEEVNQVGSFGIGTKSDMITTVGSIAPQDDNSTYFHSTVFGVEKPLSVKDYTSHNESAYAAETVNQKSALFLKDPLTSGSGERKLNTAEESLSSFYKSRANEPPSSGFDTNAIQNGLLYSSAGFDTNAIQNGHLYSPAADTYPRRSRPSFLDSLNIEKNAHVSGRQEKHTSSSKFSSSSFAAALGMEQPSTACAPEEPLPTPASSNITGGFFGSTFARQNLFENNLEHELQTTSQSHNEDFAALEQHIEDLTQEKFSLQRALEASKALSESLAAENSSLTESYNQQASIVTQLKAEIERMQGEIKARLVELEATKAEYMNAQLECNAADERAKLLASEVIGLEEKALRLRSNELKLERELENAIGEITSYKKKLASLDKDRQDLLQTIDALLEEKRLLQSKFQKASAIGVTEDINKGHAKRDASISTNDLASGPAGVGTDENNSELGSSIVDGHVENTDSILLAGDDFSMVIPRDQAHMIQNINSLISEIKEEKEELMQALVTEVATSTRLKDLNKELSYKLEVQTQRLELLTAQSMANENAAIKEAVGSRVVQESVAYADEGDEVVERVLGWIMKLFPGGPTKRRPSRL